MEEHYNKHYIKVDDQGRIVDGWSDGPFPGKDTTGAVCVDQQGGYQFRLTPEGEENPTLLDSHGVPLYKLADGQHPQGARPSRMEAELPTAGQVVARSEAELAADRAALSAPGPSQGERLEAQVAYTAMMTDTLLEV